MISHLHKTIFIHVPKTGGSSISSLFEKEPHHAGMRHHEKASEIQVSLKEKWDQYFKWAIVRNPWDRMVSMYFFRKSRKLFDFAEDHEFVKNTDRSFDSWLDRLLSIRHSEHAFWLNQFNFIKSCKNEIELDFVGRFENLNEDFNYAATKIGLNKTLPHINTSEHNPYYEYYNKKQKQ